MRVVNLSFADYLKKRFHYELDNAHEEHLRAMARMEDGEFERGFIAGLERGLYLVRDSQRILGKGNLDDDGDGDGSGSSSDSDVSGGGDGDPEGGAGGSGEGSGGPSGSGGGDSSGSGSGSGDDPDLPLDATFDAMTH